MSFAYGVSRVILWVAYVKPPQKKFKPKLPVEAMVQLSISSGIISGFKWQNINLKHSIYNHYE